jgi:hypothetical protein
MTVRTRAQLNSDADTNLADNTSGAISPEDVRQSVKNLADSAAIPTEAQSWSETQAADPAALSISSGDVDWTIAGGNTRTLSLTANCTINLPSDLASAEIGTLINIIMTQDGTGGRTVAVEAGINPFNTDTLPDVLSDASAVTIATLMVTSSSTMAIAMGGVGDAL